MKVVGCGPSRRLPEIVPIVLHEIVRLRECGLLTRDTFDQKLQRLEREEVYPRGCSLVVQEFPDGRLRFGIRETKTGEVHDLLECPQVPKQTPGGDGARECDSERPSRA